MNMDMLDNEDDDFFNQNDEDMTDLNFQDKQK